MVGSAIRSAQHVSESSFSKRGLMFDVLHLETKELVRTIVSVMHVRNVVLLRISLCFLPIAGCNRSYDYIRMRLRWSKKRHGAKTTNLSISYPLNSTRLRLTRC